MRENERILIVSNVAAPIRIDKYLSEQNLDISRSRIQQLVEQHHIYLNEQAVRRVSEKVNTGDRIRVFLPPPKPSQVIPEDIAFNIIYEDSSIAVIDKPAGLSVHPTETHKTGTLVNGLLFKIKDLSGIGGVLRPGIVHRLDRVTSGVLVVAKTDKAHQHLSDRFKSRNIKKVYYAIVHGTLPHLEGEINQPVGRHATDRKRMCVRADGRSSQTYYKNRGTGLGGTFLELYPNTGRTHQLRVHMSFLGFPIVGDPLYGHRKKKGKGELERLFADYPGIALHAGRLRFEHPESGKTMEFEVPWPPLFRSVIERMK
ncbi:RluA family pseudouridine synthase [bacterium]|nr:RluA family pseudouridine synthase [bacterium]